MPASLSSAPLTTMNKDSAEALGADVDLESDMCLCDVYVLPLSKLSFGRLSVRLLGVSFYRLCLRKDGEGGGRNGGGRNERPRRVMRKKKSRK